MNNLVIHINIWTILKLSHSKFTITILMTKQGMCELNGENTSRRVKTNWSAHTYIFTIKLE